MTENIAIYCLKAASELNPEMCEECPLYGQTGADHCCEDALQVAIKALEELQQYRTIGTVEECRAAVEKQKPMKPIHEGCYDNNGAWHEWNGIIGVLCPSCKTEELTTIRMHTCRKHNRNCPYKYDKNGYRCKRCVEQRRWRMNDGTD